MISTLKLATGILLAAMVILVSGCPPKPKEAIEFSNTSLDFERSELPIFLQVWNSNPEVTSFTLSVTPSDSWIVLDTRSITSTAPSGTEGDLDKQTVQVSVDRTQLTAGDHMGTISFTASGIVTREVEVRVTQDQDGTLNTLNVINPVVTYSSPYLVDFSFSLRDERGNTVVREPSELSIAAQESSESVASETGVHIQRGAARQLKVALVLDYTLSMQSTDGAIAAMEEAAKNTLLPALNEDALVSITEFHREDMTATEVVPFTIDRAFIENGIDSIQPDIVQGFSAASRMLDALLDAANTFDAETTADEERYIIVFTDGNDTSSSISTNDVVNRALDRGIRIYAIDFGNNSVATDLQDITTRTDGTLFGAASISSLDASFQRIVQDLDGQYNLRWASLRRDSNPVLPGFTLTLDGDSVRYTASDEFVPTRYAGNGVLEGQLHFVTSDSETTTTVFLRADYVPRFIRQFSIHLMSDTNFAVSAVNGDNDGLFAGWDMTETTGTESSGVTLVFESPGDPIPFGTFGPMLRVDFDTLLGENDPLFSTVYVDNSIYETTGGQSFVVAGYDNTPPGG